MLFHLHKKLIAVNIIQITKTIKNNNLKFFNAIQIITLGSSSIVAKLKAKETINDIATKRTVIKIKVNIIFD
ncbi:MAG: hypothetical protein V1871_07590 [Planctomycetota bacterium]